VDTFDLRTLSLRAGEVRQERLEVEVAPFVLGGQRYDVNPSVVPLELEVTRASGATVFELRLAAHLRGPCMRCLALAEVDVGVAVRELHDAGVPAQDELPSDYVVEEQLLVGIWARDAIALEIPEQILCRPECLGLCPVCGRDLNVEPHEHIEVGTDPRWAALEQLRDGI
jgi:uncharacterized protein